MSIVIDARCVKDSISGIERYTLGLLSGLSSIDLPNDLQPIHVLSSGSETLQKAIGDSGRFRLVHCALKPWSPVSQIRLPGVLRQLGCQVYHCPYVFGPLRGKGFSRIITVHDLIPHVHRNDLRRSWKSRLFPIWDRWFRAQCRHANAIVTVSEYSRALLCRMFSISPQRVHCIHNGVDVPKVTGLPDVRQRYGVRGPLIAYIGRHDPYKNLVMLVRAFDHLIRDQNLDCKLVIGGKRDPRYPDAERLVASLKLSDRVVFTGYLDEPSRIALLRESSVFAFPSRQEGFGLPPLEAMAQGVPVVASNAASLPEVLGDAAILVDPNDAAALAGAMRSILADSALADRLRKRGCERAAMFSWQKCAAEHVRVYQEALQSRTG